MSDPNPCQKGGANRTSRQFGTEWIGFIPEYTMEARSEERAVPKIRNPGSEQPRINKQTTFLSRTNPARTEQTGFLIYRAPAPLGRNRGRTSPVHAGAARARWSAPPCHSTGADRAAADDASEGSPTQTQPDATHHQLRRAGAGRWRAATAARRAPCKETRRMKREGGGEDVQYRGVGRHSPACPGRPGTGRSAIRRSRAGAVPGSAHPRRSREPLLGGWRSGSPSAAAALAGARARKEESPARSLAGLVAG